MGAVVAKFRKSKTTYEVLVKLEDDIKHIEEYSVSTQARQKRFVGNFLVISIGLYVLGFVVFYFAFFPPTWTERITYSVPMLIIPLLIFLIKRLVAWYFQRKLNKNSGKLSILRTEKEKIIEKVLETETYKVAIDILNRFGGVPKNEIKSPGSLVARTTTAPKSEVQHLKVGTYRGAASLQKAMPTDPKLTINPAVSPSLPPHTPLRSNIFNNNNSINSGIGSPAFSASRIVSQRNANLQVQPVQLRKRTPYPIINQRDKGVLEKMVDYLIGDGPQNRFAMICKDCFAHNGMALQEEYEYAAFRCAFCGAMNPSRKTRPIAPKLPMPTPTRGVTPGSDDKKRRRYSSSSSTSSGEKYSGPDTEDEVEDSNTMNNIIRTDEPDEMINADITTADREAISAPESSEKAHETKKND